MSVKLRHKKLAKGRKSLYLDIYDGVRRYTEFLDIKIEPNDKNKKIKMEIAETKRAKKEIELLSQNHDIKTRSMRNIDFLEYFEKKATYHVPKLACKYFSEFIKDKYNADSFPIHKINKTLIEEYLHVLRSRISNNTTHTYFSAIRSVLNQAVKEELIVKNPTKFVKSSFNEVKKIFLTEEELEQLSKTPCLKNKDVKKAFLFCCLTGLRYSDVSRLQYKDIKNGVVEIIQKKTKEVLYIPLNKSALKIIESKKQNKITNRIFNLYKALNNNNDTIKDWVSDANIEKHVTFHTSRHTFAVLMLSKNVPIYTVSKLMGHKNLRSTEVYAKIVDETKINAINTLPVLNI